MRKFSDMNIKPVSKGFTGEKVKINKVLNRQIVVLAFRVVASKFDDKGNGQRLDLQIELDGTERVIFTGSQTLMEQIAQVQ